MPDAPVPPEYPSHSAIPAGQAEADANSTVVGFVTEQLSNKGFVDREFFREVISKRMLDLESGGTPPTEGIVHPIVAALQKIRDSI